MTGTRLDRSNANDVTRLCALALNAYLVMLLEMVLGPYWVWLVLDEEPGQRAVVGGVIVLTVLLLHSVASLRAQNAKL